MKNLKPLLLIALLILASNQLFAAPISVAVDRNPVGIDESFQITFTATASPDSDPDFNPLLEDFSILNQSTSNSSSWINGKATHSIQWIVNVMAKNTGNMVIPAIKFGSDSSEPLPVLVTEIKPTKDAATNADIFLEVEATPKDPFLQSQVLYTFRLYRKVNFAGAKITEPELSDAVIEKLGEDTNYNTQVKGVEYVVTERRYAIFPQKSGQATIKPLVLTAEIMENGNTNFNSFFNQQATQAKRVVSKEITLDVKPKPASFTAPHWLPAQQLTVTQEWSGDFEQMKVGEPLTRTLTIKAKGTTVGQLPELNNIKSDEQLKTYPDQPVLNEQKTPDGLIAVREEKIAIIPAKAGNVTLPAIEIPWFNTQTQTMETAKIPATTVKAVDAIAAKPVTATPEPGITKPQAIQETPVTQPLPTISEPSTILIGLSAFLALGWLITVIYFLRKRAVFSSTAESHKNIQEAELTLRAIVSALKKACAANNADAAKKALLAWGKLKFSATSLAGLAECCELPLKKEILILNAASYGKEAGSWHGQELFAAFLAHKTGEKKAVDNSDALEPLYRL